VTYSIHGVASYEQAPELARAPRRRLSDPRLRWSYEPNSCMAQDTLVRATNRRRAGQPPTKDSPPPAPATSAAGPGRLAAAAPDRATLSHPTLTGMSRQ
jgi:hypothetical protein